MSAKGVKENVSVNMVNIVMVVYRVSYYGKTLIKSSDFNFKFCIPNSKNSWEHIYNMPTQI